MELQGWEYVGRNLGPEFHKQFKAMMEALSQPEFVNGRVWNRELQTALALQIPVSSDGAVRTLKRMCETFRLIQKEAFSYKKVPAWDTLLTKGGQLVFNLAVLEDGLRNAPGLSSLAREQGLREVKRIYEEFYCDALARCYYTYGDGSHLCPLRATLKALKKFGSLDKWEWYLLNTCIQHDDDPTEEARLESAITSYRDGQFQFSMKNVVKHSKGHQYIPQYFEYAGLVYMTQFPTWRIRDSDRHNDLKNMVFQDDFLDTLYNGGSL